MMLFMTVMATPEKNTYYQFMNGNAEITKMTGVKTAGGCATKTPDGYYVAIDSSLPMPRQNKILKHENCHVRQYRENRTVNEMECDIWSMLP